MKKSIIVGLCLTILLGCRVNVEPDALDIYTNMLGIVYKEEMKLPVDNDFMAVRFTELNESRCIGENIVCIWSGMVSMKFIIENQQVELYSIGGQVDKKVGPKDGEQSEFVVNGQKYILQLDRVEIKNPNKKWLGGTPKENYTVFVTIIKK